MVTAGRLIFEHIFKTLQTQEFVKYRHAILIVLLVLVIDQAIKVYIKTHFCLNEEVLVFGSWFRLHFLENEGMAFGMKLSQSDIGKLVLTLFRLGAVVFGFFLLKKLVRRGYTNGAIICGALILSGAMGNLIDSLFYGLIFTDSAGYIHYTTVCEPARMVPWGQGYGRLLHGKVVDMFYFPLVSTRMPDWMPFVGGKQFEFFEPVFNFADAAISVGVLTLIFFQKRLLHKRREVAPEAAENSVA